VRRVVAPRIVVPDVVFIPRVVVMNIVVPPASVRPRRCAACPGRIARLRR
jgi:hypothetical protein